MKYRKKPVVIEAYQFNENWNDAPEEFKNSVFKIKTVGAASEVGHKHYIETLEGPHIVSWNDFIIKGIRGEFYACKPDIFAMSHELVDREHAESKHCWCNPVLYYKDPETGVECYSHNEAGKQ